MLQVYEYFGQFKRMHERLNYELLYSAEKFTRRFHSAKFYDARKDAEHVRLCRRAMKFWEKMRDILGTFDTNAAGTMLRNIIKQSAIAADNSIQF